MALAITASVEATGTWGFGVQSFGTSPFGNGRPPRVRLDVTNTGTPVVQRVTVLRTDPSGRSATVRTVDGDPLRLDVAGTSRIGVLFDYEAPFGQQVTYSLAEAPTVTATATVGESQPWLIHPGAPGLSTPINVAELGDRTRPVTRQVFRPLGRTNAVAISDGRRKSAEGTLTLRTYNEADRESLMDVLADGDVLLLNVPASFDWGIGSDYVSFGDAAEVRLVEYGPESSRYWQLPYTVVDAPLAGQEPLWGWDEVAATYTWAQMAAVTWRQVLLGPDA